MKQKYNKDILMTDKDSIYKGQIDDVYKKNHPEEEYIDVFSYENLTLEYDFESKRSTLYLQINEDKYELLYETSIKNNIENSSFYSKNNVYILTDYNHETGKIGKLDCIRKTSFIKSINDFSKDFHNRFFNSANELISGFNILKQSNTLINNDHYNENNNNKNLFKEYRTLFVKYKSATILIPVSNILDEIISKIHEFIATGKLDNELINKRFLELQNFKEFCSNSISLLSSFVDNPNSTDLRNLCDGLEKNSRNIDNLMHLYLEDELNMQDKENNDDCK